MLSMAKPAYLALSELDQSQTALVFVPSRKQCRLTAHDLMEYCTSDITNRRFLNIPSTELDPLVERAADADLAECLKFGIGFYHDAMAKSDKRLVASLLEAGAIQVVVASKV